MPSNIEIKAYARDFASLHTIAKSLSGGEGKRIEQIDTFFVIPNGRLKLRHLAPNRGELIYYERPYQTGPKQSLYTITTTTEPDQLKQTLTQALGILGTVCKIRHLYMVNQTRIHLDEVDKLGNFVELEVVLHDHQQKEEGLTIADQLMKALNIQNEDLIEGAYLDLLLHHTV